MAQGSVTVHVLFTDLVDSTRLIGRHGADGADSLRRVHDEVVRRAITSHVGEKVKHTGDGLMAVFRSAVDAVAAARTIQRSLRAARCREPGIPEVRVGIASGEAVNDDGDWFGPSVVEVARLCAEAQGGQILATQIVAMLVGARGDQGFVPVGERLLKGFEAPVGVHEVPWDGDLGSPLPLPDPVVAAMRSVLVGREGPLRDLREVWRDAQDGRPQVALVAGEPGVGKTRLAAGLAAEVHGTDAMVLWGRCDEDLQFAYQPFSEAIRRMITGLPVAELAALGPRGDLTRIVPELAEILPELPAPVASEPDHERLRLYEATAELLGAVSVVTPLLLVIDDLHWAAAATLQLLRHIARLAPPSRLMVLGTYRDTENRDDRGWDAALSDLWRDADISTIGLTGLDAVGVVDLVEAAAGEELDDDGRNLALAVREKTNGNPFFIGQVLRHLAESGVLDRSSDRWVSHRSLDDLGLPSGVREVVGHRLHRLSPGAHRALVTGAVMGPHFDLDVMARVLESTGIGALVDDLDDAVGARLVEEVDAEPGRYGFVHALVRDTLLAGLTATKRAQLHAAIGEVLAQRSDANPAAIAHHLCAGASVGDAAEAIRWCLAAAKHAKARLDFSQMLDLADSGLRAAEHDDPSRPGHIKDRAWLWWARAAARHDSGEIAAAKVDFMQAARHARLAGDVACMLEAALGHVGWGQASIPDPEGRALLEEVRELLPAENRADRALLDGYLAFYLHVYEKGGGGRAEELARCAVDLAAQSGEPRARFQTLLQLSHVLMAGADTHEQLRLIAQLEQVATELGDDKANDVDTTRQRVPLLVQIGDREGLRRAVAAYEDMAPSNRVSSALLAMWRGMSALMDGDLPCCERSLRQLLDCAGDDINLVNSWAAQLTYLRWEQGRLNEVVPLIDQAVRDLPDMVVMRAYLAAVLAETGDTERALPHIKQLTHDELAAVPQDVLWSGALTQLASAGIRLAHVDSAAALHRHLEPFAGQLLVAAWGVVCLGATDRYLALLDELLGHTEDADRRFGAALALEERAEAPALAARTRMWWGRTLIERGGDHSRERGRALLTEVAATAEALGLEAIHDEVRGLLHNLRA